MTHEKRKILILVKTYPHPSNKSVETVCTAGLTEDGKWIRIYPVPYRFLLDNQKFKTFNWIEAEIAKRPVGKDYRKESYSVEADTIKVIGYLDSEDDAAKRYRLVSSAAAASFEEVVLKHQELKNEPTLAAVKPFKMYDLKFEKTDRDWTPEQLTSLNQLSMFEQDIGIKPLRKVPWKIVCCFDDSNNEHTHHELMLTDWQYNYTFLKLIDDYNGDEEKAKEELNKRWLLNFDKGREAFLFFGTTLEQDRFHTFITIGYCSISKEFVRRGEQISLFGITEPETF